MAKHRSPAYPAIPLKDAIELAEKLYPQASRHSIGAESVAELWGYSSVSSASPYIAAVKQFGLLIEEKAGDDRMLKLTAAAKDIAVDPEGKTQERKLAIKKAATAPNVFDEMWEKWGSHPPVDSEIRRYLEREREFNPKYVARVVSNYRATLEYAKLIGKDSDESEYGDGEGEGEGLDTPNNGKDPKVLPKAVRVGSFVQWTSQGQEQFPEPRPVTGFDGNWAFVEGIEPGLPMSELTVVDPPASTPTPPSAKPAAVPPLNPNYRPPAPTGPRIEFPLPDDNAIEIRLRKPVSKKDFERIKKLVELSEDSLVGQE